MEILNVSYGWYSRDYFWQNSEVILIKWFYWERSFQIQLSLFYFIHLQRNPIQFCIDFFDLFLARAWGGYLCKTSQNEYLTDDVAVSVQVFTWPVQRLTNPLTELIMLHAPFLSDIIIHSRSPANCSVYLERPDILLLLVILPLREIALLCTALHINQT